MAAAGEAKDEAQLSLLCDKLQALIQLQLKASKATEMRQGWHWSMLSALWGLQVLQGDGHLWLLCLQVLGESFSLPNRKRPLASLKGLFKPSQHMEMLLRQPRLDSFPQAVSAGKPCSSPLLALHLHLSPRGVTRCCLGQAVTSSASEEQTQGAWWGLSWLCFHPRPCRTAALSPAGKALTAATCSQLHRNNWRQNRYHSHEPYQLL